MFYEQFKDQMERDFLRGLFTFKLNSDTINCKYHFCDGCPNEDDEHAWCHNDSGEEKDVSLILRELEEKFPEYFI